MTPPTRTLALALVALLSSAAAVPAEVLVYSGSVDRFASGDVPPVQKLKAFVVLDQFQRRGAFLTWGKDALGKRHDFPSIGPLDYLTFPRSDGGDEDGFATAAASATFTTPTGGGYTAVFLHGPRVPATIGVVGNTKIVQPRAKKLVGSNAGGATTFLGAYYRYETYKLKLNEKLTIQANGSSSTVDQAIANLVGIVEAMGFVEK